MERFQAIAGATSRHRGAATTRVNAHKHGVKCVVANTSGMFHTRSERGHAQLAWGSETTPEAPEAGPAVLQGVQDLIAELVAKGYRIVYTDGSSKRLSAGRVASVYSRQKMTKDQNCVSAATSRRVTDKQITVQSFGQHLKRYRGFGYPSWRSSRTLGTCN